MPTPHVRAAPADSLKWIELAKVDGDGGTLTGLGVAGGSDYHYFQVELDDRIIADNFLAGTGVAGHVNNGVGVALPFSTKLIVRVRDSPVPSAITRFWVAYVTTNSEPTDESSDIREVGGKEYRYKRSVYVKDDGSEYVTESLIGPRRVARTRLDDDSLRLEDWSRGEGGYVELKGEVVLTDTETGEEERPDGIGVVIRVAGRHTIVSEAKLGPSSRRNPERVWLPAPADYAVATVLDDYSNIPAFFTAL